MSKKPDFGANIYVANDRVVRFTQRVMLNGSPLNILTVVRESHGIFRASIRIPKICVFTVRGNDIGDVLHNLELMNDLKKALVSIFNATYVDYTEAYRIHQRIKPCRIINKDSI